MGVLYAGGKVGLKFFTLCIVKDFVCFQKQ